MKTKNLTIRLNMNKEDDRRAYEYLQQEKKSYTKVIVTAICEYKKLVEQNNREDLFLERVITAVREELSKNDPIRSLVQIVQTTSAQNPPALPVADQEEPAESEETLMNFLDSF